jgi:hypothetical protein
MIHKGDIIKLHEHVFVSTYIVVGFIVYILYILFVLHPLIMH